MSESNNIETFLKSVFSSDQDHVGAIKVGESTYQAIYATNPIDYGKELEIKPPQPGEIKAVITISKLEFLTGEVFSCHGRDSIGEGLSYSWKTTGLIAITGTSTNQQVTIKVSEAVASPSEASISLVVSKEGQVNSTSIVIQLKPKPVEPGVVLLSPVTAFASSEDAGKEAVNAIDPNREKRWSALGIGQTLTIKYQNKNKYKILGIDTYWRDRKYFVKVGGEVFEIPAGRDPNNPDVEFDISHLNLEGPDFVIVGQGNERSEYNSIRYVYTKGILGDPVEPGDNHPPVANAGPDQVVKPETTVTLDGSKSYDPDITDTLKHKWTQIGVSSVVINNADKAIASFVSPKLDGGGNGNGGNGEYPITSHWYYDSTNTLSKDGKYPQDKYINGDVLLSSGASGVDEHIIKDGWLEIQSGGGNGRVYWDYVNIPAMRADPLYGQSLSFTGEFILQQAENLSIKDGNHGTNGSIVDKMDLVFGGFGLSLHEGEAQSKVEYNHDTGYGREISEKYPGGQKIDRNAVTKFFVTIIANKTDNTVVMNVWLDFGKGKKWEKVLTNRTWKKGTSDYDPPSSLPNGKDKQQIIDGPSYIIRNHVWTRANDSNLKVRNIKIGIPTSQVVNTVIKALDTQQKEIDLAFQLEVADPKGLTSTDSVNVKVTDGDVIEPGDKIVIAHVSDTHGEKKPLEEIVTKVKPNFIIHTGDVTDTEKDDDNYIKYLNELGLTYGKDIANSEGNHESSEEGGEGAKKDLEDAYPILKETKWMQTYQVGNVFIIIGNTQLPGYSQPDSEHMTFIKQSLIKAKQLRNEGKIDWLFYAQHKPYYTMKSRHDSEYNFRYNVHPQFDEAGLDVSNHGHNHDGQRSKPITYGGPNNAPPVINNKMIGDAHDLSVIPHGHLNCINGSSVKNTEFSGSQDAWTVYADATKHSYTVYTITGKQLLGQYIEIGTGKILHEFRAIKV